MKKTISELMDEEHGRIEDILNRFKSLIENPDGNLDFKEVKKIFDEFKWNLQKHMFIEEKAIFELCNSDCGSEIEGIFELMQEHGEIMDLIKEIEKNISMNINPDLSEIKESLEKHIDFEEERFYPMLDRELSPEMKDEILKRAGEILWK